MKCQALGSRKKLIMKLTECGVGWHERCLLNCSGCKVRDYTIILEHENNTWSDMEVLWYCWWYLIFLSSKVIQYQNLRVARSKKPTDSLTSSAVKAKLAAAINCFIRNVCSQESFICCVIYFFSYVFAGRGYNSYFHQQMTWYIVQ